MSLTNMLTLAIYLDPTPGGVAPELHLKEGSTSVEADLYILDASSFVDATQKDCVISFLQCLEFGYCANCVPNAGVI